MKINSVQSQIAITQGGSGLLSDSNNFREKSNMSMCEKNRGYSAEFSGSFTGQESKAAANVMKKTMGDKVLTSKWFNSLVTMAEKHNVATSALIALGLAGVMRPATTMALPGKKDKEDKIYASGHAIASGIMGFVVSLILTSPLDDALTKCFEASEKSAGLKPLDFEKGETIELMEKRSSKVLKDMFKKIKDLGELNINATDIQKSQLKFLTKKKDAMNTLMKTMPDWIIAVPRATLTIALIPPILKYVFGIEKKKKSAQPVQDNNITKDTPTMNFIEKPVFQAVKGGVK